MANLSTVVSFLSLYGGSMDYSIYDSHSIVRIDGFDGLKWFVITRRQAQKLIPLSNSNFFLSGFVRLYSFAKREVASV